MTLARGTLKGTRVAAKAGNILESKPINVKSGKKGKEEVGNLDSNQKRSTD